MTAERPNTSSVWVWLLLLGVLAFWCWPRTSAAPHPPPPAATCALSDLPLITRAEWGAAAPNLTTSVEGLYDRALNPGGWYEYPRPLAEELNTLVVHHSALPASQGPLAIQTLHMLDRGYADIAYHFVIDVEGHLYEGRPLTARGAHTAGHNTGTVGVVLLGNFETDTPTAAQLASLKTLAQCLTAAYRLTHLAGHQDFQPGETLCPGATLAPLLPALAEDLGLTFGTGGYVGTP